jgi:PAS domain-containing protein
MAKPTPEDLEQRVRDLEKAVGAADMVSEIADIGGQHYVHREDREFFRRSLNERGVVENFEHETRRKDGSTFWVSVNAHAVRDEGGGSSATKNLTSTSMRARKSKSCWPTRRSSIDRFLKPPPMRS